VLILKKLFSFVILSLLIFSITACDTSNSTSDTGIATVESSLPTYEAIDEQADMTDIDDTIQFSEIGIVSLNQQVSISDAVVSITKGGTYVLQGECSDVSIHIEVKSTMQVILVLDSVSLSSATGPVIYAEQSNKLIINLAAGTMNYLSDSADSTSEVKSTIFSNDDITVNGSGALTIYANYNNGINTDDDLLITGGMITIIAQNDGLKANDSIVIKETDLTITAHNDGIHCENTEDSAKGTIKIENGNITINAYGDGFDSSSIITIFNGTFTLNSGVSNSNVDTVSGKGIKAVDNIGILDGIFVIISKDDAIHTNNQIAIVGGKFTITSSDDGIHADTTLTIEGGTIDILKCYEGLEALNVVIAGGDISLISSDDGINVAGGNDASGSQWDPRVSTGTASLIISGGTIYINSAGDGLDANGSIAMSGGLVIVNGPTSSNNGAVDYDSSFLLTGGTLIAAGSSGMAQNVSAASTQYSVMVNLTLASAKLVRILDSEGLEIVTFIPSKNVQSVVISSGLFVKGETYSVYTGGTITDPTSNFHGLTTGGTYSDGVLYKTFAFSTMTMTVGTSSTFPR